MEGLFNPTSILLHVLNAVILFVAVYFLLYKPVRKFLKKREDKITGALDEAEQAQKSSKELLLSGEAKLDEAHREAAQTISQGAQQAQVRADAIVEAANRQADEIISAAQQEAERIRATAREAMADEAAKLAVLIAAKVLQREVTKADNDRLIDDFLKEVG